MPKASMLTTISMLGTLSCWALYCKRPCSFSIAFRLLFLSVDAPNNLLVMDDRLYFRNKVTVVSRASDAPRIQGCGRDASVYGDRKLATRWLHNRKVYEFVDYGGTMLYAVKEI